MTRGLFVSGTGTGAGKTTVTCAIARGLLAQGAHVRAIKPIETGVVDRPLDADALARACGAPELADDDAWYRARAPVSPYAATLAGERAPDVARIAARVRELASADAIVLVEGAGGLLVPIDRASTIADLARELALPLLIVAPDRLGVLSDVLATFGAAERAGLAVAAIVLAGRDADPDASVATNARILAERLPVPLAQVPFHHDPGMLQLDPRLLAQLGRA